MTGAAALGVAVGAAGIAGAATNGSSSTSDSTATTVPAANGSSGNSGSASVPDPRSMPNGPGETLLTGTTAEKVTAAAQAAVPGATVIRVETDSEGAAYEAHMQKSDGSVVTVKFDSNFSVTDTIDGFGDGPGGAGGQGGPGYGYGAPGGDQTQTPSYTN